MRYTLQQQFHQEFKSLHTDAWLEHSSSAGQRALQVRDDSKWVVIASTGLQRAATNVGAGGMLKKNLPVSISAVLPSWLPHSFVLAPRNTDTLRSLQFRHRAVLQEHNELNELLLCHTSLF